MSEFDQFRKIPSVGQWDRDDAGESGIECPVCGADSGYVHTCVECRKLDPGDHEDDVQDLADARSKPHRHLGMALRKSSTAARKHALQQWARGIRSEERLHEWLDAAADLEAAMTRSTWSILLRAWVQQRDDDLSLDDPEDLQVLVGAENAREETRPNLLRELADRIRTLEGRGDGRDASAAAEAAAVAGEVATDGGTHMGGDR